MGADPVDRIAAVAGERSQPMSAVWISRESWQKVWSALHNIRVRYSHTVKTPCAGISGVGASARINIDLPADYGSADAYDGPFAVSYDAERELLRVNGGWCNINGYKFIEVAGTDSITPEAGKLCLRVRFDAAAQKITDPEFVIAEPDLENFPLAEIEIIETGENEKYVEICQYYVTVAVFLFGRECIYAKNKGSIDG